ncbi:MAG: hypothetical protein HFG05_11160 [Oscillibacter sp.]|nr:hypothetical protein [Oscillibacter sp.]
MKNVKTPKRRIFSPILHESFLLGGSQPGKIFLDWGTDLSPLGIPPFIKQGLKEIGGGQGCHGKEKICFF